MADMTTPNLFVSPAQNGVDAGTLAAIMGNRNNDGIGGNSILGLVALLSVLRNSGLGGFDNNQNSDRAAIESAVSSALAQNNQANNNAMLLLKDIQDSSQDVVAAISASENAITNQVTQGNQTLLVNQLQNQIANLQGQGDIKSSIAVGNANLINEIHESSQDTSNQISALNTNMLKGFSDLASKIDQNLITELREQLADARIKGQIDSGNVSVTNNINQQQSQQQQQQQLFRELDYLRGELQRNTQSTIAIGSTMLGNSQTATNVRQ